MGSTARKIFGEPGPRPVDTLSNYSFTYDADAEVLAVNLTQPLRENLEQGLITLAGDGAYQTVSVKPFQLGKIISHQGGYSQVGGFQNSDGNYVTLATAVIEKLNILETLTADRVVAQITTIMTPGNPVQSVSFSGSVIDNLQISNQPIAVSINPNALGSQPANGGSYFDAPNVPVGMAVAGDQLTGSVLAPTSIQQIVASSFGTVSLGKLTVTRSIPPDQTDYVYDYAVTMIRVDLSGGGAEGCVTVVMADPNGQGKGGTPQPGPLPAPARKPLKENA
jgi:hypothetical protein